VAERFDAVLESASRGGMMVEVPFDVEAAFGAKRPPVVATVNGHAFRTTVAVYGGRFYVGLNRDVRDAAGVGPGDRFVVELARDDAPREVAVPPELAAALEAAPGAKAAFERLSFTHKREYAEWIADAEKDETKQRRVEKAVEMLADGVKHP